jgi:integrase/recombinase XerD
MTTQPISPLRQRMIEDMNARKRGWHCQRSHLSSCERFAAFLQRSPERATSAEPTFTTWRQSKAWSD